MPDAIPGDLIRFQADGKRRGALRGKLLGVEQASENRCSARCEVAESCGGCALQFLDSRAHALLKTGWVEAAYADVMRADTHVVQADAPLLQSRRRVRWHVGLDAQGIFLGFHARSSHQVIRQQQCWVVTPRLYALRIQLESWLDQHALPVTSVLALDLSDGVQVLLTGEKPLTQIPEQLPELPEGVALQWWWQYGERITPFHKPVVALHDLLPAGDVELALQVGPDDFVQGQAQGNRHMITQIIDWSQGARRVVDLFCGIGNLSIPVAKALGCSVRGAELSAQSVKRANANAREAGVDARYIQANLFERVDGEMFAGADVLVLDPPRKGAKKVCSQLGQLLPKRIIMVHCDIASGSRDALMVAQAGYRLRELQALDLFAWAGHVEAISLWERDT